MSTHKITLLGTTKKELENYIKELNQEKYRVNQIFNFIYKQKQLDIEKFSSLPLRLREILKKQTNPNCLKLVLKEVSNLDATTRYNFISLDNQTIQAVYIPKYERNVVCLSTQIGCSVGCVFCASGKNGFIRNLTANEIVEQFFWIEKDVKKINGVLFMGMGEPLLNFENLVKSIEILTDQNAFGISRKKITVSTVGILPNIIKLKETGLGVKLAVSLHSYSDEIRKNLIKNLKYSVDEIIDASIEYAKSTKTYLTIEYVIIKDLNDKEKDLQGLIKLLNPIPRKLIKINLIPYNHTGSGHLSPILEQVEYFKKELIKNRFLTFIRKPHGQDINSACGQLGF